MWTATCCTTADGSTGERACLECLLQALDAGPVLQPAALWEAGPVPTLWRGKQMGLGL